MNFDKNRSRKLGQVLASRALFSTPLLSNEQFLVLSRRQQISKALGCEGTVLRYNRVPRKSTTATLK